MIIGGKSETLYWFLGRGGSVTLVLRGCGEQLLLEPTVHAKVKKPCCANRQDGEQTLLYPTLKLPSRVLAGPNREQLAK